MVGVHFLSSFLCAPCGSVVTSSDIAGGRLRSCCAHSLRSSLHAMRLLKPATHGRCLYSNCKILTKTRGGDIDMSAGCRSRVHFCSASVTAHGMPGACHTGQAMMKSPQTPACACDVGGSLNPARCGECAPRPPCAASPPAEGHLVQHVACVSVTDPSV